MIEKNTALFIQRHITHTIIFAQNTIGDTDIDQLFLGCDCDISSQWRRCEGPQVGI